MRNITKSFIKGVFGKKIESLVYRQAFFMEFCKHS